MEKPGTQNVRDLLLDAAEAVVVRDGIANLALEAVASQAGMSKGGLLHHFPNKDRLVEAMVQRSADSWRRCYSEAYDATPEGPGRMVRAVLDNCFSTKWTEQLRNSSAAVFAALAHKPSLIEPMRAACAELHRRVAEDGLPPGIGEAVIAATDGLWNNWVLGLAPVDAALVARVRGALDQLLLSAGVRQPPKRGVRQPARSQRNKGIFPRRVRS
jgi:AcrR family transcriptional regulator